MQYDLILLGATFLSIGAASVCDKNCLIIEEKTKPGYEFIDSFHSGSGYDKDYEHEKTKEFKKFFEDFDLLKSIYIPDWSPFICKWVKDKNLSILLLTEIIDVKKVNGLYEVTVFNNNGINKFNAKNVIDTRTKTYSLKTYNSIIINENKTKSFHDDISITECGNSRTIMEMKVEKDSTYQDARKKLFDIFKKRNDKNMLLAATADEFYKKSDKLYGENTKNYKEVFSSYFDNPFDAFDFGCKIGGEF